MKRVQHKNEIINKVLCVSRDLFIKNGYAGTKIQHIIDEAGITTGSLYHFFHNKEDILLHLVKDVFYRSVELTDNFVKKTDDSCLRFSLEIMGQLYFIQKYRELSELYLVAYGSSMISEHIVIMATERNRELFKKLNPDFTYEDFYARTLAIKGILHSFIDEYVHYNKLKDDKRIDNILGLTLSLFNIPDKQIQKTIQKTKKIFKSGSIKIYGLQI
jgi:AcrR family transcriptional regulator